MTLARTTICLAVETSRKDKAEIWTNQWKSHVDLARKLWKTWESYWKGALWCSKFSATMKWLHASWTTCGAANKGNNLTSGICLRATEGTLVAMKHPRDAFKISWHLRRKEHFIYVAHCWSKHHQADQSGGMPQQEGNGPRGGVTATSQLGWRNHSVSAKHLTTFSSS